MRARRDDPQMARGLGRVLYWAITAIAIVVTVYMEMLLGPDALDKGEWTTIGLVVVLGYGPSASQSVFCYVPISSS
jgi:hypothetical protein